MRFKMYIFTIIILSFILIGSVNATDIDTNDTQTISANDKEEIIQMENNLDKLKDNTQGTYSDLKDEFEEATGDITLKKSKYTYKLFEASGPIEITKSMVIDGNGAIIDMGILGGQAFKVTASGVTIKNLTIKNAYSDEKGGAIYFSEYGTVENCNFISNTAKYGGAIYFQNGGTVTNCNFNENTAGYNGGSVYFFGWGTVTNCNFTGNQAKINGGAIRMISGSITNCKFTNNILSSDYDSGIGGAVFIEYGGTVTNCNFNANTATQNCGAIRLNTGSVTNCNFTGNKAKQKGGAIQFNYGGTVANCNFNNNEATNFGGSAVYFNENGPGTVTNCNFTNNNGGLSGTVFFEKEGRVINCNFDSNTANEAGAIRFDSGSVENCNFTNNKATTHSGGAIIFINEGNVKNCNFTNNQAVKRGGAIQLFSGNVTNCNFTNNYAENGTICFLNNSGTVKNCNFANNQAVKRGGAIYSYIYYITADTCTFKTSSDTTFNIVFISPVLNVDNFTAFYGSGEKLTFNLTTANGVPITDGNISISVHHKNGTWVGNYSCLSGEGWTPDLPVGSYYAIFNTEYGGFEPVNRTIKIIRDIAYYVNVTSLKTTNKKVNITAISNIPQDILEGELLFILPEGSKINANYAGKGIWWAVHKFADYDVYQVNATYQGLDNVTITNATISISKTPTAITVENETLELLVGDSIGTGAALTPADAGELTFTSNNITVAKVEDGKIIAVGEGTAIITVSFAGNDDYTAAEDKTINVDVIKYDSKVTIEPINNTVYPNNVTIKYSIENKTNVTVTIDGVSDDKIIITNDAITVIGLDAGEYTITIINNESRIYHQSNDTKTFTVNKQATSITGADVSTTYNINKDLVITLKDANGNPLTGASVTVDLNGAKTYTTDKNGQVKVSTKGLAPKTYTAKITFNGDDNYINSNKDVKVTVKKATPKLTAKKKTFKSSVKTKKYTIVLKDNTGKAIKKAKVTLKVKGKTYKATTNSKGKAVFKIKNLKKKGKYTAIIKFKGNKYYNKATKKAKIKVIVTFKTVSKGSKDKATVREIQQALKNNGYYLTYDGHYLKIDGIYHGCTERSVKEFQHDKGLKVTGKVDEKTAKKLGII